MRMDWKIFASGAFLLTLAYLIYLPGLSGTFLLDDVNNLKSLGNYGPIDHAWQVWAWITSGFAGPTGRPLSLASFLIDTRQWPTPPEGFKHTNVIIHLINGALLAGLSHALARALGLTSRRAGWAAVLAAGFWLLHPLWVSTTLYVIQRMAMLAALFVFAGLWAYVHGRSQLIAGNDKRGYVWMSTGLVLGTLLAVLSKENGALLPLLAWVIEAFVFNANNASPASKGFIWWRRVFIYLPSSVLLAYMVYQLPLLISPRTYGRDFTPWERLLTETRIVWIYLQELWLPTLHDRGIFNDDIRISTSLWQPISTVFAALGVVALLLISAWTRTAKSPFLRALGLALAFYFVGQILESTWLPLVLMFEHRNYLPAALMFLPVAVLLVQKTEPNRRWTTWIAAGVLLAFALLTFNRADLWGQPFFQAYSWAKRHPDSADAQNHLAILWEQNGNYPGAETLLDKALVRHPDNLLLLANRAFVACKLNKAPAGLKPALLRASQDNDLAPDVTGTQFDSLLSHLQTNCAVLGGANFGMQLIDAAMQNPSVKNSVSEQALLIHRRALYWLQQNEPNKAYLDMKTSLLLQKSDPSLRLLFAAELATSHHPKLALELLDKVKSPLTSIHGWSMRTIHERILRDSGFYKDGEAHLRSQLRKDIDKQDGQP